MPNESIWVALEPVALGVGWFTIAVLIVWTVAALCVDIARQVRTARSDRHADTWAGSWLASLEDADRVPDDRSA